MAATVEFLNVLAQAAKDNVTHIALVDGGGTEVSTARLPVTWGDPVNGRINMSADLLFDVEAGATVAGWRGFSALEVGVNYGGPSLTAETYTNAGQYNLLAGGQTYIDVNNPA